MSNHEKFGGASESGYGYNDDGTERNEDDYYAKGDVTPGDDRYYDSIKEAEREEEEEFLNAYPEYRETEETEEVQEKISDIPTSISNTPVSTATKLAGDASDAPAKNVTTTETAHEYPVNQDKTVPNSETKA